MYVYVYTERDLQCVQSTTEDLYKMYKFFSGYCRFITTWDSDPELKLQIRKQKLEINV